MKSIGPRSAPSG